MKKLQISSLLLLTILYCSFQSSHSHYDPITRHLKKPGPLYQATVGEPWPKPQLTSYYGDSFMVIRPTLFRFKVMKHTCDILEEAFKRYYSIILKSNGMEPVLKNHNGTINSNSTHEWKQNSGFSGYLDVLNVYLFDPCEAWPHHEMDESYEVKINTPDYPNTAAIIAPSTWGILHALETFSQLIHPTADYAALQVRSVLITDYPRFSFRSLLVDSSRHFLSMDILKQNLDLMAMNKLNILHWHIVDDQSFPFQSEIYPELSNKGAYHPYTHVYTKTNVREIIEYARFRGIRVIPEFDTPGHTLSWGLGQPDLLTKCYSHGKFNGNYGPIDVSLASNYDFLTKFFEEVVQTFPDQFVHLGGDEVDSTCWKHNPNINKFMKMMNFSDDYTRLEDYHMQKLFDIISSFPNQHSTLVWQEVFDRKVDIDPSSIVHVWKDDPYPAPEEIANITAQGLQVVLSSCWYLNYISYGSDWMDYYKCDPQHFNGTLQQKRLVLGGGAAMWGEMVDSTNIIPRTWPRAAAPAERLWSHPTVNDTKAAAPRLEEHRCRLLRRGYNVEPPNGPSFCNVNWQQ